MDIVERLRKRADVAEQESRFGDAGDFDDAADTIERLQMNLRTRDDFIGSHGLWDDFVRSLPT